MRRHSRAESRNRGPTRHPDARRAWLAEAARLIVQPPGYPRDAALRRAAALTGIRIGPGWRRQVQERVGGVRGCIHITELLWPLATTYRSI